MFLKTVNDGHYRLQVEIPLVHLHNIQCYQDYLVLDLLHLDQKKEIKISNFHDGISNYSDISWSIITNETIRKSILI